MPNWQEILNELNGYKVSANTAYDIVRRKYLEELNRLTNRNIILYYSGWLQKSDVPMPIMAINDEDKNGFMTVINNLDKSKGLDLILHTPGGEIAATESLVNYLRACFGTDIRAIIPQIAMSAGTMIACSCKEIIMGKQSSLGPFDPQFQGLPTHGILEEFRRAHQEISVDSSKIPVWQPIIAKYHPTLIGECEKAIQWSIEMLKEWLKTGMFKGRESIDEVLNKVILELGDHALTKSHARHLDKEYCRNAGLNIVDLEADQGIQDAILSVHHACMHTLSATPAIKIIENQNGIAFIKQVKQVLVQQ
jgi:ATP-dependent protease ClpP protease subunit